MIVQGPGSAAQSEETTPVITSSCDYPIDVNSLEFGFPGMEKSINVGAIYADIYGGGSVQFSPSGTSNKVTWQLGDPTRANAIADALDAAPATDVQVSPGQYVHRILRNGAVSPYSLYQFMNIETTHLGASGSSLNNGAVSSTFCAYAYALGGPPMTAYSYPQDQTQVAAGNLWQYTYDQCVGDVSWGLKVASLFLAVAGCDYPTVCGNAAAMVLNCTVLGGGYCGSNVDSNNNSTWQAVLSYSNGYTISPDRLGGLTRFMNETPRPTTWASDPQHQLTWSGGGRVCGCFE